MSRQPAYETLEIRGQRLSGQGAFSSRRGGRTRRLPPGGASQRGPSALALARRGLGPPGGAGGGGRGSLCSMAAAGVSQPQAGVAAAAEESSDSEPEQEPGAPQKLIRKVSTSGQIRQKVRGRGWGGGRGPGLGIRFLLPPPPPPPLPGPARPRPRVALTGPRCCPSRGTCPCGAPRCPGAGSRGAPFPRGAEGVRHNLSLCGRQGRVLCPPGSSTLHMMPPAASPLLRPQGGSLSCIQSAQAPWGPFLPPGARCHVLFPACGDLEASAWGRGDGSVAVAPQVEEPAVVQQDPSSALAAGGLVLSVGELGRPRPF